MQNDDDGSLARAMGESAARDRITSLESRLEDMYLSLDSLRREVHSMWAKAAMSRRQPPMFVGVDWGRPGGDVSCEVTAVVKPDGSIEVRSIKRLEPGKNDAS